MNEDMVPGRRTTTLDEIMRDLREAGMTLDSVHATVEPEPRDPLSLVSMNRRWVANNHAIPTGWEWAETLAGRLYLCRRLSETRVLMLYYDRLVLVEQGVTGTNHPLVDRYSLGSHSSSQQARTWRIHWVRDNQSRPIVRLHHGFDQLGIPESERAAACECFKIQCERSGLNYVGECGKPGKKRAV